MKHRIVWAALTLLGSATVAAACSGSDGDNNSSGPTQSGGTAQGGGNATGSGSGGAGGDGIATGSGSGGSGGIEACATESSEATLVKKPVDIIIVIDNSGSMSAEIIGVEQNINDSFAKIIEQSGLDYRVIMVAAHGASSSQRICVKSPLSTTDCMPIPATPGNNPPKFFQYNHTVNSRDAWCKLLGTFDGTLTDTNNLNQGGWQQWLRPEAFKSFIVLSDDRVSCSYGGVTYNDGTSEAGATTAAAAFDATLFALSSQFGDADERNYTWHSIVGLGFKGTPTDPWLPTDPFTTAQCSPGSVNAGHGHQALSILTGGLRFSLCDPSLYNAVFKKIAEGVIQGSKVACEFPIPEPPEGKSLDKDAVVVQYTTGEGGKQKYSKVNGLADCTPHGFYYDGELVRLCPATCDLVENDADAKLDLLFGCGPEIPN